MIYNSKEDEALIETGPVLDRLSSAIANGVDWLLDRQDADGFWVGMLEWNVTPRFELPGMRQTMSRFVERGNGFPHAVD